MATFDLLNPKIQRVIYEMGWTNFKIIQDEAIEYLIKTPSDLIISAPTAGGKTEACFLPIISNISNLSTAGVKILYISPLKALINDQFSRIERLCNELQFPIVKWHGDVNQKVKIDLLKQPNGILLITPESLEAIFINKTKQIKNLFKNLQYIVIDEIHSFIENSRGNHLFSLLNRIEDITEQKVIKIGLSATISNVESVKKWLNYDNPEKVKLIKSDENNGLFGEIKGYYDSNEDTYINSLFEIIRNEKNLIFANSKNDLEKYCVGVKEVAKKENLFNRFYIHHGSLSKEIRESTECKLKKENDISCFCTNTLELGIDIGDIDRVLFLDAPFSVSSAIQKIGRSGRNKNTVRKFKMLIKEPTINAKSPIQDKLRLNIIQSIAIVEIMVREKWCENLNINFNYSTIIHQILSFIAGNGGAEVANIYNKIIVKAFKNYIDKNKFLEILKSLRDNKIIYQQTNGLITLTKDGENLVFDYKFYPAFISTNDYEVDYNGNAIGFINIDILGINIADDIILGGKQWKITNILTENKKILVIKSNGGKAVFVGFNKFYVDKKIHKKMMEIYEEKITNIPYLDETGKKLFQEGIQEYKSLKDKILPIFSGTKIQNALVFLLNNFSKINEKNFKLKFNNSKIFNSDGKINFDDLEIGLYCSDGKKQLLDILKNIDISYQTFYNIVEKYNKNKIELINKFDDLLPKEFFIEEYIKNNFDVDGLNYLVNML